MLYLKRFGVFFAECLMHLFLFVFAFLIGHGYEFFTTIISSLKEGGTSIGPGDYLNHLAVPIALFLLAELVVVQYRRSNKLHKQLSKIVVKLSPEAISVGVNGNISDKLKSLEILAEKIQEVMNKEKENIDSIVEKLKSNITSELSKISNAVSVAIYNSYLREPNHIIDGFSETIRHFLQPHSGELVEPVSAFMRDSFRSILENGFVKVNADFDDYRVTSNKMVESIYESPEKNSIQMISLYSPLNYLHMNTIKTRIDIKDGKPNHLLVFNGFSVKSLSGNIEAIEIKEKTRGSTERTRIVFLKKDKLVPLLRNDNDLIKSMFIFAYLWFLSMNTEIKLGWGWKKEFRDYWYKKPEENGDVDFMIFNLKYFWRYNLDEKSLYISWDPLTQDIDLFDHKYEQKLFTKSTEYFNKAKRIFGLSVDADEKWPYSDNNSQALNLPSLLKTEEGLFLEFKKALKKGLETINDNKDKFTNLTDYDVSEVHISIFLNTINTFIANNSDILEGSLENFEKGISLAFKKEANLLKLYAYYFHGSFAEGVKNVFPGIVDDANIF